MHMRLVWLLVTSVLVFCFASSYESQTTLNYYVNFDDYFFSWNISTITEHQNYDVHNVLMRSQKWLTNGEVDKSEWYHWVQICIPTDLIPTDMSFMWVSTGSNPLDIYNPPTDIDEVVRIFSVNTGTIGVALHQIPNQPMYFSGDPGNGRSEDGMIAYTWSHYVNNTFEYDWIAQYPMSKAAIKAIDAVQQYILTLPQYQPVNRFVLAGGSKRGWVTWLAGAMGDPRIVGIAPVVAPIANLVPQLNEMWQSYGSWSFALKDYVNMNLMGWLNLPRFTDLLSTIDPLFYNEQLQKIPKYPIVASGDEFFMPDAAQYYWPELVNPKFLRIVPNAEHSMAGHVLNVLGGVEQFYLAILNNQNDVLPTYSWEISEDGTTITLTTMNVNDLTEAKVWFSKNNTERDWRLLTCPEVSCANPAFFRSEVLSPVSPGVYSYTLESPPDSYYSAFFIELSYDFGFSMRDRKQMQITSDMSIIPKSYPYPPCPQDVCECGYDCATNYAL